MRLRKAAEVTAPHHTPERSATQPESIFAHIVVGVDGTEPGMEACRQAAALVGPEGSLDLVCVVETALAVHAGLSAPRLAAEMKSDGRKALAAAAELAGEHAAPRLKTGAPTATLLSELERAGATLVAIGSHGHRCVTEIMLGGVAGELLHRAPCSVLIAREPAVSPASFPRSLVVGIDGSAEAERALAVAQAIATRFAAPLRIVTAVRGKAVDRPRVHLRTPLGEEIDRPPVEALQQASVEADLLIVGSRGLHGVRALGSVSERVAHSAACSVLVVRGPKGR